VGLAFLLVLACHPVALATIPAGMSAPAVPIASLESGSRAHLGPTRLDWHALASATSGLLPLSASGRDEISGPVCLRAKAPEFAPLHGRPPPSFS